MQKIGQNLGISAAVIGVIWAIFIIDMLTPFDLTMYGIHPRTLSGLWGLIFSPFLHANLRHILANSGALFVLLALALSYNRVLTLEAVVIIAAAGGGLVWLLGAGNTVHVGASGVIFGLIGFLLFVGIFRKDIAAILIAGVVLFFYGGVLVVGFIPIPGVSWTGHVFGFLAGVLAAWLSGAAKNIGD